MGTCGGRHLGLNYGSDRPKGIVGGARGSVATTWGAKGWFTKRRYFVIGLNDFFPSKLTSAVIQKNKELPTSFSQVHKLPFLESSEARGRRNSRARVITFFIYASAFIFLYFDNVDVCDADKGGGPYGRHEWPGIRSGVPG